jgi:hypothetical protein
MVCQITYVDCYETEKLLVCTNTADNRMRLTVPKGRWGGILVSDTKSVLKCKITPTELLATSFAEFGN